MQKKYRSYLLLRTPYRRGRQKSAANQALRVNLLICNGFTRTISTPRFHSSSREPADVITGAVSRQCTTTGEQCSHLDTHIFRLALTDIHNNIVYPRTAQFFYVRQERKTDIRMDMDGIFSMVEVESFTAWTDETALTLENVEQPVVT